MAKRVIVVASGETERRSLPHLLRHLQKFGVTVVEVRIPPSHKTLDAQMADRLIKAAWYEHVSKPPDKFVLVIDLDGAEPEASLEPFRKRLLDRTDQIRADILCTYAQEHLEAWYFADTENLRKYLGRAPGKIDTSRPDEIQNPKLHLSHLLEDPMYTARISEEIAQNLDADRIAERSPSFKKFVAAIMNGSMNNRDDR